MAHEDGELVIYDLATGQPSRRWRGPTAVHDLAFRPDGARIAVLDNERNAHLPDSRGGDRPARPVDPFARRRRLGRLESRRHHAGDTGERSQDLPLGRRHRALGGRPSRAIPTAACARPSTPPARLLASNGWEARLRLWDPVLGRTWLSEPGESVIDGHFSRDGRIVLSLGERLTTYQVDPALEFRTLLSVSTGPSLFEGLSIRHDGRVLAAGTGRGVVLWDLARGTELGFLPIGNTPTPHVRGFRRLAHQRDDRRAAVAGPARPRPGRIPHRPAAHAARCRRETASSPRTGLAGSWPWPTVDCAYVCTPDRAFQLRPLDDGRSRRRQPGRRMDGDRQPRSQRRPGLARARCDARRRSWRSRVSSAFNSAPMGNG